jgi:hypothetical protein
MMEQFYQTFHDDDSQIAVDQKLLELKDKIRPGRSKVFADVDWSTRLRVTRHPSGELEISLEDVPDLGNLTTEAHTLNDFRKMEVIIFGPHVTAQDNLAWREGVTI